MLTCISDSQLDAQVQLIDWSVKLSYSVFLEVGINFFLTYSTNLTNSGIMEVNEGVSR